MDANTLKILNEVGIALSKESDMDRLLEIILLAAKEITNADGASLYKVSDRELVFKAVYTSSLDISSGGDSGLPVAFPTIPLYDPDGRHRTNTVISHAVLNDMMINVSDVYASTEFDFSGTREFDNMTGYRSQSILTAPIKDHSNKVLAALQLINAQDHETQVIQPFSEEDQRLVESLASQASAAIARQLLEQYKTALNAPIIVGKENEKQFFSKVRLRHLLEACALAPQVANDLAAKVLQDLVEENVLEVSLGDLHWRVHRTLATQLGRDAAARYSAWIAFKNSGWPMFLLIGGGTGTGKSTIAADLAQNLDIGRVQSTDTLREVMRVLVSEELVPALHASTYDAWRTSETRIDDPSTGKDHQYIVGLRRQTGKMAIAINGVLKRSIEERVSTVIEGIHIDPAYYQRMPSAPDSIVVPVLLVTPDPEKLKAHLESRERQSPTRSTDRYLGNLDAICKLQEHLIREARRCKVPAVPNIHREQTVRQILNIVTETLLKHFQGTLDEVFSGETK